MREMNEKFPTLINFAMSISEYVNEITAAVKEGDYEKIIQIVSTAGIEIWPDICSSSTVKEIIAAINNYSISYRDVCVINSCEDYFSKYYSMVNSSTILMWIKDAMAARADLLDIRLHYSYSCRQDLVPGYIPFVNYEIEIIGYPANEYRRLEYLADFDPRVSKFWKKIVLLRFMCNLKALKVQSFKTKIPIMCELYQKLILYRKNIKNALYP